MNSSPAVDVIVTPPSSPAPSKAVSWGAIAAGAVTAVSVHFLFTLLFSSLGLGLFNPASDDNPVATFGIGSAIVWTVSSLLSLMVGGAVAGWFAARIMGDRSASCHGFLVWAVATVVAIVLAGVGAGAALGGASQLLGTGASKAAGAAGEIAREEAQKNSETIKSYITEGLERREKGPAGAGPGTAAATREITTAVGKVFPGEADPKSPEVRQPLVKALTTHGGYSEADANATVDNWIANYEQTKAEFAAAKKKAEEKAREAAQVAAKVTARSAFWTFAAFLAGACAGIAGGRAGSEFRKGIVTGR